jgi:hypothetical protein
LKPAPHPAEVCLLRRLFSGEHGASFNSFPYESGEMISCPGAEMLSGFGGGKQQ